MSRQRIKGAHFTIDFFGCDPHQLNSLEFWQNGLVAAANAAKMDILHSHFHKFDPQGITGFLLLSSSHISFHTWPEYNYVACDVFSCSNDEETYKAVLHLKKIIQHKRTETNKIKRGYVVMEYLTSPIYKTGKKENIRVVQKVADITSAFQNIVLLDTAEYGRCMVIDGLVQTSEFDHEIYDKSLLRDLSKDDKRILILGGGDGYVAEMAIKLNPGLQITIVELDPEVVALSKRYLNQKSFLYPNVHLNIGDALSYLRTHKEMKDVKFDGIVCDLTDNPVGGTGAKQKYEAFYSELFQLAYDCLNSNGWLSAQAGASKVIKRYIDSAKILKSIAEKQFGNSERQSVNIPSFSEENAFIYTRKK
jgi:spermidine synthase